jgi:thiol-disulfide isomerase/thioredoxin
MTKRLLFFLFSLFFFNAYSQNTKHSIKPLKVGEKVPDIVFQKILNYKTCSAKLSDLYKDKILILDFWNTFCTVCIEEFPRMKALQEKYGENVLILPVGIDWDEKNALGYSIENFLNKRKGTQNEMPLPTIVENQETSKLLQYFPIIGVPAEIWINAEGVFIGMSDSQLVSSDIIDDVHSGIIKRVPLGLPKRKISMTSDFLLNTKTQKNNIAFTPFQEGLAYDGVNTNSHSDFITIRAINLSITDLYRYAYLRSGSNFLIRPNTEFKIFHSVLPDRYLDWREAEGLLGYRFLNFVTANLFCFDANFPLMKNESELSIRLIEVLDSVFRIKSKLVSLETDCFVLNKINGNDKLDTISYKTASRSPVTIESITTSINAILRYEIVLDETGIDTKKELKIDLRKSDSIKEITEKLQKIGIDLVPAKRKITRISLTPA